MKILHYCYSSSRLISTILNTDLCYALTKAFSNDRSQEIDKKVNEIYCQDLFVLIVNQAPSAIRVRKVGGKVSCTFFSSTIFLSSASYFFHLFLFSVRMFCFKSVFSNSLSFYCRHYSYLLNYA